MKKNEIENKWGGEIYYELSLIQAFIFSSWRWEKEKEEDISPLVPPW